MFVSQVMSRSLVTLLPEDTVESAARLLAHHNVGALPVCTQDGKLRGLLTDRDIAIRAVADNLGTQAKVKNVMSKNVVVVEAHAEIEQAAALMSTHKIRRLPVVKQGKIIGMISLADIAKTTALNTEAAKILSHISK